MMLNEDAHIKHPENDQLVAMTSENQAFLHTTPSVAILSGDDVYTAYQDETFNEQRWTRYSVAAPASTLIVNYTLPITVNVFLEASFYYSHDDGVAAPYFLEVASAKMDLVRNTFNVRFAEGNALRQVVEQRWFEETPNEIMLRRKKDLMVPLFGVETHQPVFLKQADGDRNLD